MNGCASGPALIEGLTATLKSAIKIKVMMYRNAILLFLVTEINARKQRENTFVIKKEQNKKQNTATQKQDCLVCEVHLQIYLGVNE